MSGSLPQLWAVLLPSGAEVHQRRRRDRRAGVDVPQQLGRGQVRLAGTYDNDVAGSFDALANTATIAIHSFEELLA